MARAASGNLQEIDGHYYARFSLGGGKRVNAPLKACDPVAVENRSRAERRTALLAEVVRALRAAEKTEHAEEMLKQLGAVPDARLDRALALVRDLCNGVEVTAPKAPSLTPQRHAMPTYEEWTNRWLDGELATEFPDHIKPLKDPENERGRLRKHVFPHLGHKALDEISLEMAEDVMRRLPRELERGTRRHIAQLMARPLRLAVVPGRLIQHSPIPPRWLPRPPDRKAASFLYASEDLALLQHRATPLIRRLLYGFLNREGMRRSEAVALEWSDIDLGVGAVRLDENKTNDPRFWALATDVAIALRRWKTICPSTRFVFPGDAKGRLNVEHLAQMLRDDLKAAGVTRSSLFEESATRMKLRAHDLRATFVTLSLAVDRSETWISDRTGHRSSEMIRRYRRAARAAAELKLGWLVPLHEALPELYELAGQLADDGAELFELDPRTDAKSLELLGKCDGRELNPHALRRRNLKTVQAKATVDDSTDSSDDEPPESGSSPPIPATSATSANRPELPHAPRGPMLRRAAREAVEAAMTGDPEAIRVSLERFADAHVGSLRERPPEPILGKPKKRRHRSSLEGRRL